MKILRVLVIAMLVAIPLFSISGNAQATYFSYATGIGLQNLSASTATIQISFYDQSGNVPTTNGTVTDSITAHGSTTYFPLTVGGSGASFNGSAVVSSDMPLGAIVNVLGSGAHSAGASYVGFSSGAASVSLPLLFKGQGAFNSWYNVQNIGTAAATVRATYSDGTFAEKTVPANAAATFDQALETHSKSILSAVITTTNPAADKIVATVIEEDPATMFAYNGFAAGSKFPVMPLINYNGGWQTGVQIQNQTSTDSIVTVTYSPSTLGGIVMGTTCTETQTIAGNQAATFAYYAFMANRPASYTSVASTTCVGGQNFVGAASVTANSADVDLVAIVNQTIPNRYGEAYGAFAPSDAKQTVVFPLIFDRFSNWYTGFNVYNVGGATHVTCTFSGSSYTYEADLASGAAFTLVHNGQIASGYKGSAICSGANVSDQLVGITNEFNSVLAGSNFLVYEGIGQ